jgi:perosamine synthetase
MNIFNSLGSNYDFDLAIKRLETGNNDFVFKLKTLLEEKYRGKVYLTYKGREALRIALNIINLKGSFVGICGFTCYAVYEAVIKEGYNTEYLDIGKNDLNFSLDALENAVKNNPQIRIIFIQNTLGYPCDIEKITKFCNENNIILIEDLAHSIGAKYENGKETGTIGDFTMLSFSQDKVIDSVSGGALIVRNKKYFSNDEVNSNFDNVKKNQQLKDKLYPISTLFIRKTYGIGIGKFMHAFLKSIRFLSNPMLYFDMKNLHALPASYAKSIYKQFKSLDKNLDHRRMIANIYKNNLNEKILNKKICDNINFSSNLRFPIFVDNRDRLIKYLDENNIFVSDIWYDAPIAPKRYLSKSSYKKGMCPNSEKISENILNLPTHKNISEQDAKHIASKINLWLKSH